MIRNLRHLVTLLTVVTVLATAQAFAAARGASDATGRMVICTGTATLVVYTDAEGQPTQAPHICPDAAMMLAPGDDAMSDPGVASVLRGLALPEPVAQITALAVPLVYRSRAPPWAV